MRIPRRDFITTAAGAVTAAAFSSRPVRAGDPGPSKPGRTVKITAIEVVKYRGPARTAEHLEILTDAGQVGRFGPLGWGIPQRLQDMAAKLREFLIDRDPLDRTLQFETLWNRLYPGKRLRAYAEGVDPLSGRKIWGTTRDRRHSPTGVAIMTLSAMDNALWDLRGKLLGRPVHRLIGKANRRRIQVYTRVGEGRNLEKARKLARELFDRGHRRQKWYFVHGPKDGRPGLRACLELVRVLREELGPSAVLMFDNHSMRHEIGPDWVVALAKGMSPYKPFWMEEPTAPEDLEGYGRIKGETGITIATGEHHYTRWQIKPLLDRRCVDWVQLDPDWCGGISEWLRACALVQEHPGVRVVPHSDNILADCQCVASQPEALCPMLEYNAGQTNSKLSFRTRTIVPEKEVLTMPDEPGLGPDVDLRKCRQV